MRFSRKTLVLAGVLAGVSACGYHFQRSESPILENEGIHRIYVSPLVNNTYKPGVENLVYNALLKALTTNQYVHLVQTPELADAVLTGVVNGADYGGGTTTPANQLSPLIANGALYTSILISVEYTANLNCTFQLTRRGPTPKGKLPLVWSGNFGRSKPFTASNQLGAFGTTSALVNESEFERSLVDLAQAMMIDVRESMLSRF